MNAIPIEQAQEGDILAREITNSDGAVILTAGCALSASMISRLKKMGIQLVHTRDQAAGGNAEAIARQQALLEQRFTGTDHNPFLQELKAIVKDHLEKSA